MFSVLFSLFVCFMLGFSWQHVHCRQWTRNHQHWANPVHARTCPRGATFHYLSYLYRRVMAIIFVDEETRITRMVFLGLYFMSFFFFFLPFLRKYRDDVFTPTIWCYWMTNSVPKVLWKHKSLMIWVSGAFEEVNAVVSKIRDLSMWWLEKVWVIWKSG